MSEGTPDRYRYIGSLDDELIRARSTDARPPDLDYVNTILAQEALFGVEIALNDGHLFHYDAGRQALTDRNASPLLDLIDQGFVTILSRNGDLAEMPKTMAHVPSFKRLLESPGWPRFHQRLREVQRGLRLNGNLRMWPELDLGAGFARLLRLSIERGGAIGAMEWNGVTRGQLQDLAGRFDQQLRNSGTGAARSTWNDVCDTTPGLSDAGRSALRWLALETYHHNFAMAMATVLPEGGMGVITRCSDVFSFVHEEPWVAGSRGASLRELPILALPKKGRAALANGRLLTEVVRPGTPLNNAKSDYLTEIERAVNDRTNLPAAHEAADAYARLLAEHFAGGTRSNAELILQIVTAAFGAGAAAGLGLMTGPEATLGGVVGNLTLQGTVAGLVVYVSSYVPVLVRRIRAAEGYDFEQHRADKKDIELSRWIAKGSAFTSVTINNHQVADHISHLDPW